MANQAFKQPPAEIAAIPQASNPGSQGVNSGMQLAVDNGAIGIAASATARHIGTPGNSTAGSAAYSLLNAP